MRNSTYAGVPSAGRTKYGWIPSSSVYQSRAAWTSSAKKLMVVSPRSIGRVPSFGRGQLPPILDDRGRPAGIGPGRASADRRRDGRPLCEPPVTRGLGEPELVSPAGGVDAKMGHMTAAAAPADEPQKAAAKDRRNRSLWRHRDFMMLWAGQAVSEIGSAVTIVALPLAAVVLLHAATFEVGLLAAAGTACFLLVALPGGLIVDRVAKRRLMIACDVARMLILGSVVVGGAFGVLTMAQLFAVALLTGLATRFFDVAYQSYVPGLIEREQLHDGNGKLGATQAFSQVAGPGLGGAWFG